MRTLSTMLSSSTRWFQRLTRGIGASAPGPLVNRSVLRTPGGARCLHILPKAPIPALLRSRTVALSSTSAKKEKNDNAPSPEPASASSTESGSDDVPTIDVDVSIEGTPLAGNSVAASLFGGGGESKAVAEIAAQLRADAQLVVALALAVEDEAPGSEDGEDGPQLPPEVLEMLRAEGAFDEDEDDEEEEEEENDAEDAEDEEEDEDVPPQSIELSLVLCDDAAIRDLNRQYRKKNYATDVLSFPQDDYGAMPGVPMRLLGDLVISLDTAKRQAEERGHSLLDECRILLVHGMLHLVGFDHERSEEEAKQMAELERDIMKQLEWKGEGLIALAGQGYQVHKYESAPSTPKKKPEGGRGGRGGGRGSSGGGGRGGGGGGAAAAASGGQQRRDGSSGGRPSTSGSGGGNGGGRGGRGGEGPRKPGGGGRRVNALAVLAASDAAAPPPSRPAILRTTPEIRVVALDMDGTTLGPDSNLSERTARALRATVEKGIQVVIATGKARPAVVHAMRPWGLAGRGGVVGEEHPGIFLQGLAVYGRGGRELHCAELDPSVVCEAFQYALDTNLALCAFLGDDIVTARMHPCLEELHTVYHEPRPTALSLDQILAGPPVRKLLFMTTPETLTTSLAPFWREALGSRAQLMQAVPDMLEVLPPGVNKGAGLRLLLGDLGLPAAACMAVGDGGNDLDLLRAAGLPVAMGNAVAAVKAAAHAVVGSNAEDGVAEALEQFVL